METMDRVEEGPDPVISEIRGIKRQVVAEHGGDLDSFFAAIRQRQSGNPRLVRAIGGAPASSGQPTPDSTPATEDGLGE